MNRNTIYYITLAAIFLNFSFDFMAALATGKRGAENKNELSEVLFNAMKNNDFSELVNYIPQQNELEAYKKNCSIKDKPLCESVDAEKLKSNTEANFNKVIKKGIDREINWSEAELVDKKILEDKNDPLKSKIIVSIQDMKGVIMKISFDVIRIKDKWFIFQGIRQES
jgi:hypothetical protein